MFVIGLTGSLKTGKTTVSRMFARLGAQVVDADKIAHTCMNRGQTGYSKIVKLFGIKILRGKDIDRPKLARIVFKDKRQLKKLEAIIHPFVVREMKHKVFHQRKKSGVIVLDVPLLFESGLDRLTDLTLVVRASQPVQITRAIKQLRISKGEALRRIKAQMPLREKIKWADCVIDNSRHLNETKRKVNAIWQKVQRMKKR